MREQKYLVVILQPDSAEKIYWMAEETPKQAGPHRRLSPKSTATQVVGIILLLVVAALALIIFFRTVTP